VKGKKQKVKSKEELQEKGNNCLRVMKNVKLRFFVANAAHADSFAFLASQGYS